MRAQLCPAVPLAVLTLAALAVPPARADYTYGCTLPMIPGSAGLAGGVFDADALVEQIAGRGEIQVQGGDRKALTVVPQYSLWAPASRAPLASGRGRPVSITAGLHKIAAASDGLLPQVADAVRDAAVQAAGEARLEGSLYPGQIIVVGVRTLDHQGSHDARSTALRRSAPALDWPRERGVVALVLEWVDAEPVAGSEVRSHALVVFVRAIGETEKN